MSSKNYANPLHRALIANYCADPVGFLTTKAAKLDAEVLEVLVSAIPDMNLRDEAGRTLAHGIAERVVESQNLGEMFSHDHVSEAWLFALTHLDVYVNAEDGSCPLDMVLANEAKGFASLTRSFLAREAASKALAEAGL